MKWNPLLLTVLGFIPLYLSSAASQAANLDCQSLPKNSVDVSLVHAEIQKNYAFSFIALKGMTERYSDNAIDVLGLTVGNVVVRSEIKSSVLQAPSKDIECSTHQIHIAIGYQPITIYVGNEFPEGSCGFKEIFSHEMRHAEIYQARAREVVSEVASTLQARIANLPPLRGNIGITQEKMANELSERWTPYIKRLLNKAEIQQKEVDTREEYERVASSCNGEIKKVVLTTHAK